MISLCRKMARCWFIAKQVQLQATGGENPRSIFEWVLSFSALAGWLMLL